MGKHNEMTRYAFISHMEDYMKKLLKEPFKADTDEFLKSHGIEGPVALEMLLKRSDPKDEMSAILIRTEKIKDNGVDKDGKKLPDSFTVKYKIPRKDYTKKMRNLFINLFESNIVEGCPINEDGEGGCMGGVAGATNAESSGQYTTPLFGKPIKRKTLYLTERQVEYIKESTAGDDFGGSSLACPMGGKLNKGSKDPFYAEANDHSNIMKKSWNENLNESQGLKSKKLFDIFSKYGRPQYGKHYSSSEGMDLHNVVDSDVVGVYPSTIIHSKTMTQEKDWIKSMGIDVSLEDSINNIELSQKDSNGNILYAVIINRNGDFDRYSTDRQGGFRDFVNKTNKRQEYKMNDGSRHYQWKDKDAEHLVLHNPYYKEWPKESQRKIINKIKNTYNG